MEEPSLEDGAGLCSWNWALQSCLALISFSFMVGVFIGVTVSGFWEYNDTKWYNLTENIYSHLKDGNFSGCVYLCISFILKIIQYLWNVFLKNSLFLTYNVIWFLPSEHKGLTLIDMVLTNHFLVLLTSLGLFVSTDLRYPVSSGIKVWKFLCNLSITLSIFCGIKRKFFNWFMNSIS